MQANFTLIRYVKLCPPDSAEGTFLLQFCKDSSHITTNKGVSEKKVVSYFQRTRTDCLIESFNTAGLRKKMVVSLQMGFVEFATQFWSNGLYLSNLVLSKVMICFIRKNYSTWIKRKGNKWNVEGVYEGEKFHNWPIVVMWMVELPENRCVGKGTLPRNVPKKASLVRRSYIEQNRIERIDCLCIVWYWSSRTSQRKKC